jgi:hypothetical protein
MEGAMSEPVKRSFNFPPDLYMKIVQIAEREDRTVNAQVVRWLEKNVREYEAQEKGKEEKPSGNNKPARAAA